MTYTIKNIPPVLHARLKQEAQKHRRSINSEILEVLEEVLLGSKQDDSKDMIREARILRSKFKGTTTPEEISRFKRTGRP